jgi:hypothetical protein
MRIDSRYPGAQVDIDRRVEIYRRRFLFVIPISRTGIQRYRVVCRWSYK